RTPRRATRAWRLHRPWCEAPRQLPGDPRRPWWERLGPVCLPSGASYVRRRVALWAQQVDSCAVMCHLRLVPVTGAVDRDLRDGAVGHVGTEQFAAVPRLAVLVPLFLDFEHEAGGRCVETRARHTAWAGVPRCAHADDVIDALPLQAPPRHDEVAERVRREHSLGWRACFEEGDDLGGKLAAKRFV